MIRASGIFAVGRMAARHALTGLLCLALMVWSVLPSVGHAPAVFDTVRDHLEMIADHGHSHGFSEDLFAALHGHSHDVGDHDHGQALLVMAGGATPTWDGSTTRWHLHPVRGRTRAFPIERPPRA
jgi:hypothetical protein